MDYNNYFRFINATLHRPAGQEKSYAPGLIVTDQGMGLDKERAGREGEALL